MAVDEKSPLISSDSEFHFPSDSKAPPSLGNSVVMYHSQEAMSVVVDSGLANQNYEEASGQVLQMVIAEDKYPRLVDI